MRWLVLAVALAAAGCTDNHAGPTGAQHLAHRRRFAARCQRWRLGWWRPGWHRHHGQRWRREIGLAEVSG